MRAIFLALVLALLAFSAVADQSISGCDVCQFFVKEIETEVSKYDGKITDLFKQEVCGKLPAELGAPCSRFVDAFGAQAIKYLLNEFDRLNVCQKLRLCDNSEWIKNIFHADEAFAIYQMMQKQVVSLDVTETPYCGICQFVVANLEQYINQSESQIEQEALKLCKLLPDQYIQLCDTLALMYLPNIIEQLLKQETPKVACCQLTLCSDSCGSKAIEPVEQPKPVEANDGNCALCTYVVTTVEQYLANNQTQQQIIAEVNQLCGKLPTQFTKACISLADQYIPYIIYYIESQYPANKVCQLIGMCTSKSNADMKAFAQLVIKQLPSQEVAVAQQQKAKDQSLCQVCTLAMTILQQYLNSNSTDAQIKQALEQLCQKLPTQYSSMCTVLVDTYEPTLMALIRQYVAQHQLSQICHDIGICTSAKLMLTNAETARLAANVNAEFCAPCVAVVTLVENKLNDQATRQQIKDSLVAACDELPIKQLAGMCKIVVLGKTDELIDEILKKASPSDVCTAVHLCQAKKLTPNPLPFLVAPKQENSLLCPLCKEAVAVADNYITSNSTLAQIKTTVETVICDKFPSSFRQQCDQFVESYAPYLISAFVRGYLSPEAVCTEVRACSAQKVVEKVQNKITVN